MTRNQGAEELAHRMAEEFEAAITRATSGGGSRDYQPGGGNGGTQTGTMAPHAATSSEVEQRFLPALAALLPAVVSAVPGRPRGRFRAGRAAGHADLGHP